MLEWEAVAPSIHTQTETSEENSAEAQGDLLPAEPHARENGSSRTACGLDATAMDPLPQRWEAISVGGKCQECFTVTQDLPPA